MRKPDRVRQPRPACTGTLSVVMSLAVFLIGLAAPAVFAGINWYEDGLAALHEGDYDLAIKDFTLMLEVFPEDYEALSNRGVAWFHKKAYDRAIEDAARALEINPYYSIGANQLAWMLATCPDPQYRDGRKAVMLAEKVVERFPEANFMDTLAAAYAEAGNLAGAVEVQRTAVERVRKEITDADSESFEKRLAQYGQAAHTNAGGPVESRLAGLSGAGEGKTGRSRSVAGASAGQQPSLRSPTGGAVPQVGEKKVTPATAASGPQPRFSVHLISLRREDWAYENAAARAGGPYPVFVQRAILNDDTVPWFRVLVGAFDTRQAAQAHAGRLTAAGEGWTRVIPLPAGLTPVGD